MSRLADIRASYDTVADDYTGMLRGALAADPVQRGVLALFAELVRSAGGGPVADVGCGSGRLTAHLHGLGPAAGEATVTGPAAGA